jgi:O-methyltransferase
MKNLKLEFLKRILTDTVYDDEIRNDFFNNSIVPSDTVIERIMEKEIDPQRNEGLDWPDRAHTMIGIKRLNNLHSCLDYIRTNKIEGDLIETGVWRGGACIFMKYYNDLYKMNKKIFVADSFQGLPEPDLQKYPQDINDTHHQIDYLKVSLEEVKNNFNLYGVLDENVIFLKGWFKDTLEKNPLIKKLGLLRFDGDMYGSTIDVLESLYDKIVDNGILIIDDYCLPNCLKAITDFRNVKDIKDEIEIVDKCGIFWYKK